MSEQLPISDCLPLYTSRERNKELGREEIVKRKAFQNELFNQLTRLMSHFRHENADIHHGTGICYQTLTDWTKGKVQTQLLDENIKLLASFYGVSLDYLCFKVSITERDFEIEKAICETEDKGISA